MGDHNQRSHRTIATMLAKILLITLVSTTVVLSAPERERVHPSYQETNYNEEPARPYKFDYGVQDQHTSANYGHSEVSTGEAVEGSYKVALPDGRVQTVTYIADPVHGFQAQVSYEGEAVYPEEKSYKARQSESPRYQPEPPQYRSQSRKDQVVQYEAREQNHQLVGHRGRTPPSTTRTRPTS